MRVVDLVGAAGGDLLQPLGIEIGPRRLGVPVQRIEQADMRGMSCRAPTISRSRSRNSRSSALFSTSIKTARNGVMTAPVTAVFATLIGSRPHSLT